MTSIPEGARAAFSRLSSDRHALTIGNFDGVHRGHLHLLGEVMSTARRRGARSLVVTFEPHPIAVLRPEHAPPRISTPNTKLELLDSAGIHEVVVIPFDRDVASLSAAEFLDLLVSASRPTDVLVGKGFRFGKMRAGDTDTLCEYGASHGFETHVLAPLTDAQGIVSSSRVRTALRDGHVNVAAILLGRRFRLAGAVEHGMARGHDLGYPTANLSIPEGLCVPGDGIYAGYAHVDDRRAQPRQALIYIGSSPTFGERERLVEVNILDYRGDLYSQELEIEFLEFIRTDKAFDSADDLVRQMQEDEMASREILARSNPEQPEKGD